MDKKLKFPWWGDCEVRGVIKSSRDFYFMTIHHTTIISNLEEIVNQIHKELFLRKVLNKQIPQNPFLKEVISCKIVNSILNGSLDMGELVYFHNWDIGISIILRPIFLDQFGNFKLYKLELSKIDILW